MNTTEERAEYRRKRLDKDSAEIEKAKAELAENHGLERNAKFECAWRIAWGLGHSAGINEVKIYFDELAELLKL